jgi:hypothetical protein
MNDGRRALLAVLQCTKAIYVAARCRVTLSAVYNWTAGRCTPNAWARAALFASYGIPPSAWDEPRRR